MAHYEITFPPHWKRIHPTWKNKSFAPVRLFRPRPHLRVDNEYEFLIQRSPAAVKTRQRKPSKAAVSTWKALWESSVLLCKGWQKISLNR